MSSFYVECVGSVSGFFPNHFQIIEDHEGWEGVKNERCNYLLRPLV